MKKLQAKITIRLVAAMLVAVAVTGLSTLATHPPTQNQKSVAHSLKNIQTDKTTLLYANGKTTRAQFVEMVLPGTSEKAETENLKLAAATL